MIFSCKQGIHRFEMKKEKKTKVYCSMAVSLQAIIIMEIVKDSDLLLKWHMKHNQNKKRKV